MTRADLLSQARPPLRAALYARYSTGGQSPLSIEDQLRLCRELAARHGAHVVREFADAGISGEVDARPGLQDLLAFVRAGGCDVVIAEHSNRLARSGSTGYHVFETFQDLGIRYLTCEEGEVTELHQGVSSLVSGQKLREAKEKTRRGLRGVVEAGRSAGGLTYGYRVKRTYDATGEPVRGLLEVDEVQAETVRRIFRDYAAGASPRAIAQALNLEGVPGPRGGTWNMSSIAGNAARGVGILHNTLYVGERVWGRRTFVKDRATGKRKGREAPPTSPLVRKPAPELAIVPPELWAEVRARHALLSTGPLATGGARSGQRRPQRLFSGLIACGLCGRAMQKAGPREALRCVTRIEKGLCDNSRTPGYPGIEARVIAAIRGHLLTPDAIEYLVAEVQHLHATARRDAGRDRHRREAELAEVKRRASRLVDQVADGQLAGAAVSDKLAELDTRRAVLEAELADAQAADADPGNVVAAFGPATARRWRQLVEDLGNALADADEAGPAERDAVRRMITAIRVTPRPGHGQYGLEIVGDLAPLLHLAHNEKAPAVKAGALGSQSMGAMGAGTRITRSHTLPPLPFALEAA